MYKKITKDKNVIKKLLENEKMIMGILEFTKTGTFPNNNKNAYFNSYTTIQNIADCGDYESEVLFEYYNKTIQNYIENCYKTISKETTSQLIDSFIKQTENINFLIYWMQSIFAYLERFYLVAKQKGTLSKSAIKLYKDYFFNPLENKIYAEVDKLIEEHSDLDSKSKIETILKIINDLDLSEPKISKENNKICWIQKEDKSKFIFWIEENKYQDKWSGIISKYEAKFK